MTVLSLPAHEQVMQDLAAIIKGLNLDGIYDKVYVRTDEDSAAPTTLPCVLIEPWGDDDSDEDAFETVSVNYQCLLTFHDRKDTAHQEARPRWLKWRRQVRGDFRTRTTLPTVSGCWNVEALSKLPLIDRDSKRYQHVRTALTVNVLVCEPRVSA